MSSVRKNASIATLAVSGSRIAGLVREMVFAFFFGAGPVLDAFIAAFRIPNLLRDLFSEGALSQSFVTVFSKKQSKEGDEAAWDLANRVLTFVFVLIGTITILGMWLAPWIVSVVASGFEGEKYALTVFFTRLLFPFILFVSMAAVAMGMLNTKGKFALPQSASTFFNLVSIICGLGLAYLMSPQMIGETAKFLIGKGVRPELSWLQISDAMTGMATGTLIGGFVQWFVQMPSLFKLGFKLRPKFNLRDSGLLNVLKLTGPAIIGGAAVQVNVLVNTNYASYLVDGSISWLAFAFRLMQFPIGVFGVAIAVASAPALARLHASNEESKFRTTLKESLQMALFLCIPSALGLIFFAEPIIALIYQYGRFSVTDTYQAALALKGYAVGLTFYALIKIYQPAFLAYNDAKTPMLISLVSIAINASVGYVLVFILKFNHWGLALAISCVAILDVCLFSLFLCRKIKMIWTKDLWFACLKILAAASLSILVAWTNYKALINHVDDKVLWARLALVFVPIGIAILVYYFACSVLKVHEVTLIREWVRKKFGK